MYAVIDDLHKADSYVAVYDNSADVFQFKFGKFLCMNESRFAMLLISPNGDYDGIVVDNTEDIFRIDSCGRYHEKMAALKSFSIESLSLPCFDPQCIDMSILLYAKELKRLVSIELHDSGYFDVVGLVEDVSEGVCRIHIINEYGESDGCSFINMDSISKISCDSEDERRVMRLYQISNQSATVDDSAQK